jgi:hypothetical protein
MFIHPTCPRCGTTFEAPARVAGGPIRCKACREEFEVGGGSGHRRTRRLSTGWLVAGFSALALFGVAVLVAVGCLICFVNRNEEPPIPNIPVAVMPAEKARPPGPLWAPAHMGEDIFVLSNPKRVPGLAGRPAYEVDYAFKGGTKLKYWHSLDFALVARSATVRSRLPLTDTELRRDSGTLSFQELLINRLKGKIEIYVGRGHGFGEFVRVSNVVTLEAD